MVGGCGPRVAGSGFLPGDVCFPDDDDIGGRLVSRPYNISAAPTTHRQAGKPAPHRQPPRKNGRLVRPRAYTWKRNWMMSPSATT